MTITLRQLLNKGRTAAERWRECDDALTLLQDTYGDPYEDARNVLNDKLLLAEGEGFDLRGNFQGKKNAFKYPDLNAQIVVRIHTVFGGHETLTALEEKKAELLKEAKVVDAHIKAVQTELLIKKQIRSSTHKITTAFKSL